MEGAAGAGKLMMVQHLMLLGCPWDGSACETAARGGHVDVLRCLKANGGFWDKATCASAAECGQLEALRYLKDNGCPWDKSACTFAAGHGQLEVLQWLHDNGCPWDVQEALHVVVGSAAASTDVLQYLKQCGAVLDSGVMWGASECGELRTVQWLHEQGCPWNDGACEVAAQRGRIDVLQYLMEHGCPWTISDLYSAAAECDQRAVLTWLRQQGHAWTATICTTAAGCGNLPLLTWLREQTPPCPWDSSAVHVLVADAFSWSVGVVAIGLERMDCRRHSDGYTQLRQVIAAAEAAPVDAPQPKPCDGTGAAVRGPVAGWHAQNRAQFYSMSSAMAILGTQLAMRMHNNKVS